jgi:hypothetical protein
MSFLRIRENKAGEMKMRKLLILTSLIFGFCTTAFAEETKSSKYPNILYLSPRMETRLDRADKGDEISTLNLGYLYAIKMHAEENNAIKSRLFLIEMKAAAEAQGNNRATKILNSELQKSDFELIFIPKARAVANSPERKSQAKPISKILERYNKPSQNRFYHLDELSDMYEELRNQTEK